MHAEYGHPLPRHGCCAPKFAAFHRSPRPHSKGPPVRDAARVCGRHDVRAREKPKGRTSGPAHSLLDR